jgi:hypothetical protein
MPVPLEDRFVAKGTSPSISNETPELMLVENLH